MIPVGHHDTTPSLVPSRVAVYCRVSSEEQKKRQTIRTQIEIAERYLGRTQLPVHDWYLDDGISGTIALEQRPAGSRLLADARAGKFGAVLLWKLDRLGRDSPPLVTLMALEALVSCGIEIVSLTEHL